MWFLRLGHQWHFGLCLVLSWIAHFREIIKLSWEFSGSPMEKRELRPPANNQHPPPRHVRCHPESELSGPRQAFGRLQPQLTPWPQTHERPWARKTQLSCFWISNLQELCELVFSCLKLLNMELLYSNGKLMQLKFSFLTHSVNTTSIAVYWKSIEKVVTTNYLLPKYAPQVVYYCQQYSIITLKTASPVGATCDWDCFHEYIYSTQDAFLSWLWCE